MSYSLYNSDPVIRTYSGQWVNVFDPDPSTILIEDIAQSLTHQCRFAGHTRRHLSVAQHSINCCFMMQNPTLKLDALMHDATEAYLMDLPRPIKRMLPEYNVIEEHLQALICAKFNLIFPVPQEVWDIDNAMLQIEWDNLVATYNPLHDFGSLHMPDVKKLFLQLFHHHSR